MEIPFISLMRANSVMFRYTNSWRKAVFSSDVASVSGMSLLLGGSFKKCKDLQISKCEIGSGTGSPFYDACTSETEFKL